MAFFFLIVGLVLVITGVQNTQDKLFALVKGDFIGPQSFTPWLIGLIVVWSVGFVKPIRPIANAFLVLVIIVIFLSHGGFFQKFTQQTGL